MYMLNWRAPSITTGNVAVTAYAHSRTPQERKRNLSLRTAEITKNLATKTINLSAVLTVVFAEIYS